MYLSDFINHNLGELYGILIDLLDGHHLSAVVQAHLHAQTNSNNNNNLNLNVHFLIKVQ
jgi:hypothetical protein